MDLLEFLKFLAINLNELTENDEPKERSECCAKCLKVSFTCHHTFGINPNPEHIRHVLKTNTRAGMNI